MSELATPATRVRVLFEIEHARDIQSSHTKDQDLLGPAALALAPFPVQGRGSRAVVSTKI